MDSHLSLIIRVLLGVVVLAILAGGFYIVPSGQVAVEDHFGKYKEVSETAGLQFKWPVVEDFTRVDVKLQTVNYHSEQDADDGDGIINLPRLDVPDQKNVPFYIELTITYTPIAEKAPFILTNYGTNYFDKVINPRVRDVVRDVGGVYSIETVANNRDAINANINKRLAEVFKDLPFTFDKANLRAIELPPSIAKAVLGVQEAKQEEQRLTIVANQAEQVKRQKITIAEGEKQAAIISAEGSSQAILLNAKAQAEGNQRLNASLTPLLVQSQKVAKWNGTVPTMVAGGDAGSFLVDLRAKGGE